MSKDAWLYWYEGKDGEVETDIPSLTDRFTDRKLTNVLDLGCGTGRHSVYLSSRGFQVSGFDWSENAIKRTKARLEAAGIAGDIRLWEMRDTPYPYSSSSFDAVVAIKVIHHAKFEDIKRIMHEIERVTRSGGYLYLQVPVFEKEIRLEQEGIRCEEVETGTFLPLEGDEKGILHHYFHREELLSLLENYNIEHINIQREHYCVTSMKK